MRRERWGGQARSTWQRYERRKRPRVGCCTPLHISTRSFRMSLACASLERMKQEPTVHSRYLPGRHTRCEGLAPSWTE